MPKEISVGGEEWGSGDTHHEAILVATLLLAYLAIPS